MLSMQSKQSLPVQPTCTGQLPSNNAMTKKRSFGGHKISEIVLPSSVAIYVHRQKVLFKLTAVQYCRKCQDALSMHAGHHSMQKSSSKRRAKICFGVACIWPWPSCYTAYGCRLTIPKPQAVAGGLLKMAGSPMETPSTAVVWPWQVTVALGVPGGAHAARVAPANGGC